MSDTPCEPGLWYVYERVPYQWEIVINVHVHVLQCSSKILHNVLYVTLNTYRTNAIF